MLNGFQGPFTEDGEVDWSLRRSLQGCTPLKSTLSLLFPVERQIPNSRPCFWCHSTHSSNRCCGATARAPPKVRWTQAPKMLGAGHRSSSGWSAAAKPTGFRLVRSLSQHSCYSAGTWLCLCEHRTLQHFKTWSSNSKRHSIYLLIAVNF